MWIYSQNRMRQRRISGFTLVEISVVLMIMVLLIGGILAGKAMVEESRFTAWLKQIKEYRSAFNTFQLEYGGLPGDFDQATTFFTEVTTFNGNGDGVIAGNAGFANTGSGRESPNAMQHLILADLLSGDPEATDQRRPTPVGGTFRYFKTGTQGNGHNEHKMFFWQVPLDYARWLDQEIDDGYGDTGMVTEINGTDWPDYTGHVVQVVVSL